jgi:hypothetical protein
MKKSLVPWILLLKMRLSVQSLEVQGVKLDWLVEEMLNLSKRPPPQAASLGP